MFCRVWGFRVFCRVCLSLPELPKVSGTGMETCYITHISSRYCGTGVRTHKSFGRVRKMLYPSPGYCTWHGAYRTRINSGYGYESLAELPEVPGVVTRVYVMVRPGKAGN